MAPTRNYAMRKSQYRQVQRTTPYLASCPDAWWTLPSPTARCHSDKDADAQCYGDSNERTLFSFLRIWLSAAVPYRAASLPKAVD
jgi:hypothetical protein